MFNNNFLKQLLIMILLSTSILSAGSWGDYTLYTPMNNNKAYLIDLSGNYYKIWNLTGSNGYSGYLLPGGILVRSVLNVGNQISGAATHGKVQKIDFNGTILWDYIHSSSTYVLHHDICPMPNGNVLMISYEIKTAAEATAAGCSKSMIIWSEKIIEVKPTGTNTGEIIWEWHVWDHLAQNLDKTKPNYVASISEHPELFNINYNTQKDWIHMNGIDYNQELDQIAFSSHNWNEVYIIDHSTTKEEAAGHTGGKSGKGGDLLYRWGNPATYSMTGTKIFKVVHDAHWVKDGNPRAGKLVGFNNGGVSSSKSSVDILDTPWDGNQYTRNSGSTFLPETYAERIACTGFSSNMGNSQQLPNGNTLICLTLTGLIYEVDPKGTTIWSKQMSGGSAQSSRYSKCFVAGTLEPAPTITKNGNELVSSDGASYQWFRNGEPISEATSKSFTPVSNGKYQVQVVNSTGCESLLSSKWKIDSFLGVDDLAYSLNDLIFPNPTNGEIRINLENMNEEFEITIFDTFGNKLINEKNNSSFDLSKYENGVYFVKMKLSSGAVLNNKIIMLK